MARVLVRPDYKLDTAEDVRDINIHAAKVAREAIEQYLAAHPGERKYVAGAIGPTNRTLSVSPDVGESCLPCMHL